MGINWEYTFNHNAVLPLHLLQIYKSEIMIQINQWEKQDS